MPYHDASLPIPDRVADLLGRTTLDEKLAQLYSYWSRDFLQADRSLSTTKIGQ
jgi:hypothetical protein